MSSSGQVDVVLISEAPVVPLTITALWHYYSHALTTNTHQTNSTLITCIHRSRTIAIAPVNAVVSFNGHIDRDDYTDVFLPTQFQIMASRIAVVLSLINKFVMIEILRFADVSLSVTCVSVRVLTTSPFLTS